MNLELKYERLKNYIKSLEKVCIAFSGGVDSTLLAKVSKDVLGENAMAVTVLAEMHPKREMDDAREPAKEIDIKHITIHKNLSEIKEIKNNPENRCYICKKEIFSDIIKIAKENKMNYVLDGSNIDDLSDYRPGMKAIVELKVKSPLKEAGLTKQDIRELSKKLNLKTYNKPAFACLATRIPHGEKLNEEKLMMVEKAEDFLISRGFNQMRVRHHGEIARIEIARDEREKLFDLNLMDEISKELKDIGFKFVCVELEGYKMGNMNKEV